jgi:hypothetical protein
MGTVCGPTEGRSDCIAVCGETAIPQGEKIPDKFRGQFAHYLVYTIFGTLMRRLRTTDEKAAG